jgi:predicted aldo/keto reductase-like oxidoreductase
MINYQEQAKKCLCCTKHVPLPTLLKEYNEITLCPTTFTNVMEYKRIWESLGSKPTGSIRKHFSEYVQKIVEASLTSKDV